MSDLSSDDNNTNDDQELASGIPPTLDQVHQMSQAKVEAEDYEDEEDLSSDNTDDTTNDDEDEQSSTDGNEEDDSSSGEDEDNQSSNENIQQASPVTPEPVNQPATELDTDITKAGKDKVAIKDSEGQTFYFNNTDEIPEDFEPASYKALIAGTKALYKKEDADERASAKLEKATEDDRIAAENQRQADAMQDSWEADAQSLVSAGLFPKDTVKLEAAKTEVYDYISAELKKGNVITNFNQAYKSMMFDREQVEKAARQKEINDSKKKRGGMVQSGSGGANPGNNSSTRGKVLSAPPTGVGLDAVHNRAIEQLNN